MRKTVLPNRRSNDYCYRVAINFYKKYFFQLSHGIKKIIKAVFYQ